MPGWHTQTKPLVAKGKLQVYGIAPEQYGDRMALYLQWQKLDFPVLMDPLNLLNVKAVPITLLVDESGIIRYRNPRISDLQIFLKTQYPSQKRVQKTVKDPFSLKMNEALINRDASKIKQGLAQFKTIENPSPELHFQAGVLSRWLHDFNGQSSFQEAVNHWQQALRKKPNQYIWRRRIQQFGPRLDKPYPFYNWIEQAQSDVKKRGDDPVPLIKEPSGSEVAMPLRKNATDTKAPNHPDPENRLSTDQSTIKVTRTQIPHTDKKSVFRLHLLLEPKIDHYWSSDAQSASLWLKPKKGKPKFLTQQITPIQPDQPTSTESRSIEVDLTSPQIGDAKFVLYFSICEKDGTCRFLKTEW